MKLSRDSIAHKEHLNLEHFNKMTIKLTVRSVNWTDESPGLGFELTDVGSPHFHEESSSVDGAEVGDKSELVDPFGNDREAVFLDILLSKSNYRS